MRQCGSQTNSVVPHTMLRKHYLLSLMYYMLNYEAKLESMRADALSFSEVPILKVWYLVEKYNLSEREAMKYIHEADVMEDDEDEMRKSMPLGAEVSGKALERSTDTKPYCNNGTIWHQYHNRRASS